MNSIYTKPFFFFPPPPTLLPLPSKVLIDFSCDYEQLAPTAFELCVWWDARSHAGLSNPLIMQKLDI